ncbi:MAG: hypothetical protein WC557_01040 [Ignavibacteriaceae bacterium]
MANLINLSDCLEQIKTLFENAIRVNGDAGKKNVINSKHVINILHEVVKSSLVENGINPGLINPRLGETRGEVKLAGFVKLKTQDICVFPNHITPTSEKLNFHGLHYGKTDGFGELFSEHILTINLRSQLSALSANIDTMYERTYAEPLNLHRRLPKMVIGEVYMIAARELDNREVVNNNVVYAPVTTAIAKSIETYINGFSALNNRLNQRDDDFKYERVALVIADFSQNPVKVYNNIEDLKADSLLPQSSNVSLENMTFDNFIVDLIRIYERRFGTGKLS